MRILHVIRHVDEARGLALARRHARDHAVTLLLLHDAVLTRPEGNFAVVACRRDVEARGGLCPYPQVTYDGIVELLETHEKVFTW